MGVSSVDFGFGESASVDAVVNAVEQGLEIIHAVRACIKTLQASGSGADVRTTIALLLVELGGYDCALLWRVDGSLLTLLSAAFAEDAAPLADELGRLAANPPRLEEFGLEAVALRGADRAATGSFGSGGPLEPILGSLSYAVAAVRRGSNPTFAVQAICRGRRTNEVDRDLVLAFAELTAALITDPGGTELLNRCREWAGAASGVLADDHPLGLATVLADEPTDDADPAAFEALTPREREVLAHALTGGSYVEIADRLFVSLATIHTHMQSILRKLNLHSRVQLIARYGTAESRAHAGT